MMKIPVFELKRQFQNIKDDIEPCIEDVLSSGFYILGKNVAAFEKEFANYCRVKYAIGVASGTDALKIALRACHIGPGDEVITTPFTFLATAEAIYSVGTRIVFADINLNSYTIDPGAIEKKITKKTKAIICVHLYGQPCDIQAIMKIARRYNLRLIEDCAQATGAEYKREKVGTFGDAGCFSFYPTKNLGAYGDGGMVTTNSRKIAEEVRMLRVHGSRSKFKHVIHGYNSRLDELQAAVLRVKLKYLDKWNESRRKNAAYYNERLAILESEGYITRPIEQKNTKHVYHLYVLRVRERTALIDFLKSRGIGTSYHYPIPLHLEKVYKDLGYRRFDFLKAESAARGIITVPLYPEIKKEEIDYVVDKLFKFFKAKK